MLIETLDHKGRGITRNNGKILFVENALPGEDVEIIITKQKKKYDEGSTKRVNKKSKNRINPKCPYYLQCGGCQIMHMTYKEQLVFKYNKISNIIDKYIDQNIMINPILYSEPFYYRNKIRLQVNNKIGLYEKESNDIVEINECIICNHNINDKINQLKQLDLKYIKDITIRANESESIVLINSSKDIDIESIRNVFDNIIVKTNKTIVKQGHKYINIKLNKIKYQVSIESFFQVNLDIMQKMYDYIKKQVTGCEKVLDLYCGTGTISLYIKDVVSRVDGVEINKQAIVDANINKKLNKCHNVFFNCSDTKDIEIKDSYDSIIVDPPRSGLNKNIIEQILHSNANKIIYVSCDPMTLVRDLKVLNEKYNIEFITPFDMFPNTYHVECVCVLKLR